MKLTTNEILEAHQSLLAIFEQNVKLPAQTAWNLYANLETLEVIVERFNKQRDTLLSPLQEKDAFYQDEKGHLMCKKEFTEEYMNVVNELEEFLKTENEIEVVQIKLSSLPLELTLNELRTIKFMIEE